MTTPSPRNSIRIARGLYADLLASVADLGAGELCYSTDHDKFYTPDGVGGLLEVGKGTAIASIGQLGDVDLTGLQNGQVLKWDGTSWSPAEDVAPVTSVAGKVGVVTLVKADITDFSDADYATAAQGATADTAVQPGDLAAVATSGSYNDLSDQPTIPPEAPVDSVAGKTGVVTLVKADITDFADGDYATAAQGALADTAVQPGDLATVATTGSYDDLTNKPDIPDTTSDLTNDSGFITAAEAPVQSADLATKADLVGGVIPNSQLPSLAISEYLGSVASESALLNLSGQRGDWAIRTDTGSTWVVTTDGGSSISDWTELATPADAVTSVNGYHGTVVLGASDVGAATTAQGSLADSAVQPGDNISDLNNDTGFITSAQAPVQPGDIPVVGAGVITLESYGENAAASSTFQMNQILNQTVTLPQIRYSDLSGTPTIPSATSDLTNDSGFITTADVDAVPVAGGQFTGDIEIGTGIDLNTNGNAEFTGNINIRTAVGSALNNQYTEPLKFAGVQDDGTAASLAQIKAQGKSNWGGDLVFLIKSADGNPSGVPAEQMRIAADGTATFAGQVNGRFFQSTRNVGTATCFEGVLDDGSNPVSQTALITADGSATFASTITAGGTYETTERTITAGSFDLATGNHWTCGAITVPAPTNATAGTSGLIRITAGPVVWNGVFKFPGGAAPTIAAFPAIIPFYVQSSSEILMGNVAEGIA